MKTVIVFLFIAVAFSSCTTQKLINATKTFMIKHNVEASVKPNQFTNTTHFKASIDSLYNTTELKKIAPRADVTFKVSDAKVIIEGDAVGSLDSDKIVELFKALYEQIKFWK